MVLAVALTMPSRMTNTVRPHQSLSQRTPLEFLINVRSKVLRGAVGGLFLSVLWRLAGAASLESLRASDPLPAVEQQRLLSQGVAAMPEMLASFGKVDWARFSAEGGDGQELAQDTFQTARIVALGDSEGAVAPFLQGLRSRVRAVRQGTVRVLVEVRATAAALAPALEGLTADPDGETRRLAVEVLRRSRHPDATMALSRLLRDPDVRVRCEAARGIVERGDGSGWAVLREALRDADPTRRDVAAYALGYLSGPQAQGLLETALRSETDPVVVGTLVKSFRRQTGETDREVRLRFGLIRP